MGDFGDLFNRLDADDRVKGKQFEHICKWFLTNDPTYKHTLRRVWLWDEWRGRWGGDAGIDLVAEDQDGRLWAIQAKAYDPANAVTKADVDKFLAESSRAVFSYRLLIATTDKLHHVARRTINNQEKQVAFVGLSDLLTSEVDWPTDPLDMRPSPRPKAAKPREHQREAIRDVMKGFTKSDRGQLIMACGTGKTLTSLFIREKLAAERTLVLVPSLSLLKQTLQVWRVNAKVPFEALPVCSDETVGRSDEDAAVAHTSELGVPVTTDPQEIAAFLRRRAGPRVVLATYQSSPQIAEAFVLGRVSAFDLVVADEAHRVAGIESSDFATVLDDAEIKARRRLFMTATPRYFTGRVRKAAQGAELEVASMDDTSKFGSVFHRLTFGEAIKRNLLNDYQVAVVGVDNDTYLDWAEKGTLVTLDEKKITDARTLAGQIGLAKAMRQYDLHRIISFHSRVARAREFASEMPEVVAWMPARQRPKGALWSNYASGEMTAGERHVRLQHLSRLDDGQRGLLANARCLSEGVDVPTLDGVAFIDPRRSEVDIVQAVGRAIRKSADKNVGTIVIPVFIDTAEDPEVALDDSVFKPVWDVIKALRAHDAELGEQLDELRRQLGRGGKIRLPGKIHFDLPTKISTDFARAFDARLVEQTTVSWEFWYGLLEKYVAEHGDAEVHDAWVTKDGYRLGKWVGKQRTKWEKLTDRQRERLNELPGWTHDAIAARWEKGYRLLQQHVAETGDANPPSDYESEGFKLGIWVRTQRANWETLTEEKQTRLRQIDCWMVDLLGEKWDRACRLLEEYAAENGTALVKQTLVIEGIPVGRWVSKQRDRWDQLTDEQRVRLRKLPGWTLDARGVWWEEGFGQLEDYVAEHGTALLRGKVVYNGFALGRWVTNQKTRWKTLSEQRQRRLSNLPGWTMDARTARWEEGFSHLRDFTDANGAARLPSNKYVHNGFKLGVWVNTQRQNWEKLSEERRERLNSLPGWTPNAKQALWDEGFSCLLKYVEQNGGAAVPTTCVLDGYKLGQWVNVQRVMYRKEALKPERFELLRKVPGWVWSLR